MTEGRFGMPSLIHMAPTLKTPWLGLYGDLDQGIPVGVWSCCAKRRQRHPWRPRLYVIPRQATVFTATCGTRTTRRRPKTHGSTLSLGSRGTCRDHLKIRA